ncbi:DUF4245 domain-containing protein [Streptomyces sp. NPDC050504]|uniref:DUF4245 domain-containing protein n=1 Tax=Streptomyces sp. NPDC050504 TaxID=3365618 RepID=UPI0037BA6FDB
MAASNRGKQSVRNMFLSLVVIVAVAGVMYLFIPHDEKKDPVKRVDYRVELLTAQRAAPYPVLAPQGLSDEWKATSVTYSRQDDNTWHLGYIEPDGEYIGVEQSTAPAEKYIAQVTHRAEKTERTQKVGDQVWERWEGEKYDALVRREKGATTVVTGTAPFERLAEMAAALKAK